MGPEDEEIEEALSGLQESSTASTGHTILRPMVLSLIQSSYTRTQTLPEFARDVYDIMTTALSVPVAFAEGFLRSFLSIESVLEDDSGRVVIRPREGASEEDLIRDVDELTAAIDPGAVYNPLVREQMDRVAEATNIVMQQDLLALSELDSAGLSSALEALVDEQMTESVAPPPVSSGAQDDVAELRERLARVRESIREYQAGFRTPPAEEPSGSESPRSP